MRGGEGLQARLDGVERNEWIDIPLHTYVERTCTRKMSVWHVYKTATRQTNAGRATRQKVSCVQDK